jgi:hypothetical protein
VGLLAAQAAVAALVMVAGREVEVAQRIKASLVVLVVVAQAVQITTAAAVAALDRLGLLLLLVITVFLVRVEMGLRPQLQAQA